MNADEAAGNRRTQRGTGLFCENLRAWLDGAPLRNVIGWERGY
jgi:hypothetical protein